MLDFWRSIGKQMTQEELVAYSENGPIRRILHEQLFSLAKTSYKTTPKIIEVGGMLQPLAFDVCNIFPGNVTNIQLIDPIYSVKAIPKRIIPRDICLETFAEGVETLSYLFDTPQGLDTTLVLENVVNYLPLKLIQTIVNSPIISSVILGNRSNASWGELHSSKASHEQLLECLFRQNYKWVSEPFITETAIAGVLNR